MGDVVTMYDEMNDADVAELSQRADSSPAKATRKTKASPKKRAAAASTDGDGTGSGVVALLAIAFWFVTSWLFNALTPLFERYVKAADGSVDTEAVTMIELLSATAYGLLILPVC